MFRAKLFRLKVPTMVGCGANRHHFKIGILAIAALMAHSARAQEKVGYVLEVHGAWVLGDNSASLKPGDAVAGGTILRNGTAKPSDSDRIVVADLQGNVIKRIRCKSSACNECRDSGTCYDPIQPLPASS